MPLLLAFLLTLSWERSPDPDVSGYWIYQGSKSGHYTNVIDVGNSTNFTVVPAPGVTNYFAVRAYGHLIGGGDLSSEYHWPEDIKPPIVAAFPRQGVTLSWGSVSGAVYRVTCVSDLSVTWYGWVDLTTNLTAYSNIMEWSEPVPQPERFYRVVRIK